MKFLTNGMEGKDMEGLAVNGKGTETRPALLRTEDGDNQIVVSVILIVIAVGLCLIFKEQIGTIITNNITAIGTKISDILSGF